MKPQEFVTLDFSSQLELLLTKGIFQTFLFAGADGKSIYKLYGFYVQVLHGPETTNCRLLVLDKPSVTLH